MTEPTQAQREAAIAAMQSLDLNIDGTLYADLADAALTAAAEVDTAQRANDQQMLFHTETVIAREVAATIERCAQVALEQRCERGTPWDAACVAIAAAIRAIATEGR